MTETETQTDSIIREIGKPGWLPREDMLFDSENEAYEFYNTYAENLGFFVRRSTLWTTSKNIVTRRTFVCSREGFREKKKGAKEVKSPRPETRIGCPACMTIRLTPNGKYRVTEFAPNHNHQLATLSAIHMLRVKKMRRKAHAVRADLVDDSVRTPEFETEDEAYEFYSMYAVKLGFAVRRASMTVSADNVITRRMFVCSREGFRENKKGSKRVKKPRPETRTGCPACMIIRMTPSGKYHVSEFVTYHNHQLATRSAGDLVLTHSAEASGLDDESDHADVTMITQEYTDNSNQKKPREHQDFDLSSIDNKKHLRSKRIKPMQIGDAGATLEFLQNMQEENPSFFYAVQVDEDNSMINFFWADAKSVMDFNYFGDVVCLDTTYRLYGYGRPFALFFGVNHHKQTVVFGSALLYDESTNSLKWLFETFKTAMSGRQPQTILTDRSDAMDEAIAMVWSGTAHRYCVWHIYQNAMEQLSQAFHGSKTLSYDFSKCLFDYEDEEEFLLAWNSMLEKYDLKDNQWLAKLFEQREKWALVYGRQAFYADLKSIQQKESLNSELKKYLTPETELLPFFEEFERILEERRLAELQADIHATQSTHKLPSMRILKQAAIAYTPAAFKMFEREFELYMDCMLYSCGEIGTISTYKVTIEERHKDHFVKFDSSDKTATCTCKNFEFVGIHCCHVLKVLDARNIKNLPPGYILKRWTKDAKAGAISGSCAITSEGDPQLSTAKRYSYLCRIFSVVAARAAKTMDSSAYIENQPDVLIAQLNQILRARPLELPPLITPSCGRPPNPVDSVVIGSFHNDRINPASFMGHSSNGLLSSRLSHPTMCWGQFPAGPPEQ
ncbi:protein FAR1-RELATED SEQUENCE 5-like [Iris pallida]|uniref:Protein FAR1-RELATED SEQUENCE n=1 Tax=Iris pallida TaxID=29817 RepID=A0AAX6EDZ7_IRIPA|nr:protein FAR1-RELATED SEQUENCE 5-like [Iris pallida]KAJ6832633.1 protein FAR1-RELATED SEQUENCE 5-like [Iris pallida]